MNWEMATFLATAVVQLMGVGIIYGRFKQQIEDGAKERAEQGRTIERHAALITMQGSQIVEIKAYQDGFRDGKQSQREHKV